MSAPEVVTGSIASKVAVARVAVAGACLCVPGFAARIWAGEPGESRDVHAIVRSFAIRDLVLGLGPLLAARRGGSVRGWVEAGLLSDASDLAFALVGRGSGIRRVAIAAGVAPFVAADVLALLETRSQGNDTAATTRPAGDHI